MSDLDRATSDPTMAARRADATEPPAEDLAMRAADLADDLYARAERQRRRESLEDLIARDR